MTIDVELGSWISNSEESEQTSRVDEALHEDDYLLAKVKGVKISETKRKESMNIMNEKDEKDDQYCAIPLQVGKRI